MADQDSAWARARATLRHSGPLWTASLIVDRLLPGTIGLWPDVRVAPEALSAQVEAILLAWGMPEEHAAITARLVLYADLHGIDSHGASMLRHYHRELGEGSLVMGPKIAVVRESDTTALIDGGGGLGHVPGDMAMRLAMAKCRSAGIAAVTVRNSGHFGAAGAYAAMAAEAGLIGLATTSTRTPAVVPTAGVEAKLGTNPIAFAAPAKRHRPFLLDMATSTASLGRMMLAWRRGRLIPTGWAIDRKGEPVTNGRTAAMQRRLTPLGSSRAMGSHKGYGLAAMVEILSSVLPGAQSGIGHFFLALDPQRFRTEGAIESDVDGLIDALHACKPLTPKRQVLVAGEPEYAAQVSRSRDGIPLSRSVVEDLRFVAHASRVPFRLGK